MKKVLILTYYWPPAGGAGVQRWLKFSKYLPAQGWTPVIYTSDEGEYPAIDHSLEKDVLPGTIVLRTKIWEPYSAYKKLTGKKSSDQVAAGFISEGKKPGLMQKLAIWIRGNLFIPDARKYWIKPSVAYLNEWLKKNEVDAMISTGPPHTMHLIALGIKKKNNIPWIADFRDPWTNIDFYDQLMLSAYADKKHKRLEREVLSHADKVVTVSWHWAGDFRKLSGKDIEVVTNGYDEEDFRDEAVVVKTEFAFHHIGALNKDRNPHAFWMALEELLKELPDLKDHLKIRLAGKTDFSVFESLKKHGLDVYTEKIDYVPHTEIIKFVRSSPILLLPLNDTPNVLGIIPGKLFEYIASGRPIFAIGNTKGDSARIISETSTGCMVDFTQKNKMKELIKDWFEKYKSGNLAVRPNDISGFSRKKGAEKFASLLNGLTS